MKWIIVASVFIAASLVPIYAQNAGGPAITGTCASIGYSTTCCPWGGNCQASDGNRGCGSDCHVFSECCSDVACPRSKLHLLIKPAQ